jgi:hypothetical protein
MASADKAMYATKTAGRNNFRFANGQCLHAHSAERPR